MITLPRGGGGINVFRRFDGHVELLVQSVAGAMCCSDLELIDGTIDLGYVHYPLTLGHERVGRLIGAVNQPADGLVAVEGINPCGRLASRAVRWLRRSST
jgi:threonine dehydrogenase-like Zn-dependent dehydrogenase